MHSDGVLKLGEKIVEELGLDQSVDTLGRWMAHYISEKIADVESATGEDREKKMSICADSILNLWTHRSELPSGKRPFEEFESVFNALQSLDPDDATPRYYRQIRSAAEDEHDESSETAEWLRLASGIDYTARALIRYCLAAAAEAAVDKSKDWVALADVAGKNNDFDVRVVINLIQDAETLTPKTSADIKQDKIKDLINRLEAFSGMASKINSHFLSILQANETTSDCLNSTCIAQPEAPQ
ncbi:hypothetical protein KI811_15760 [Geobacter hydrogenophilus]|uniref:Uncharacterized protein n=1 Tax=Geobacter hydrogenophilus TaxID=40983 RepID=A0A9W6LD31_9BACT|nr:AVAST type 3 anti-phage proein Avs3b [Geobacter hydrogenophilus]MBT0895263.1 hypothetical protein [Geobacter hydrogenophilus]GLI39492.1 hypothetical protein GHYDROH2_29930 [Geobacter hydrogenophilus]